MRSPLPGLALLALLGLPAPLGAGEDCPALLGEAGQPSDLDGCLLEELLARADLRYHLSACVRRALEVELPPPARLDFRLALHTGGGVGRLELVTDPDQAGLLGRCALRVLGARLHGGRVGRPALLEGWLRLPPEEPARFAFGLSGSARTAPPPPAPLAGGFEASPDGPLVSCELGAGRLVVRLGGGGEAPDPVEPGAVEPRVLACLDPARPARGSPAGRPPRSEACLEGLLRAPEPGLRAAAAEALARARRWRARRAVERCLLDSLRPTGADAPLRAPADEPDALAAVRLLEAALALYRQPDPAALEALAAHPSALVRQRLLERSLPRWRGDAGAALRMLSRAPEPLLRARAQQLGCLRGEMESLRAFREDLGHPAPGVRAQAVLLARACARRSAPEVLRAALREPVRPVAMLLLQAAPAGAQEEVRRLAPAALEDACPAARFLAQRLLSRLAAPPREPVLAALERERDPLLRAGLEALLRPFPERPPPPVAQLWLQAVPGLKALPSGVRFE